MFTVYAFEQDKKGRQKYSTVRTVGSIPDMSFLEELLGECALDYFYSQGKREITFIIGHSEKTLYRRTFFAVAKVVLNPTTRKINIESLSTAPALRDVSEEFRTVWQKKLPAIPNIIPSEINTSIFKYRVPDYPRLPTYETSRDKFTIYGKPIESAYDNFNPLGFYGGIREQMKEARTIEESRKTLKKPRPF